MNTDQKPVLLPKTDYVSHYGTPVELDNKAVEILTGQATLEKYKNNFNNADRFVIIDGPPYANGNIHIGHALNKILKDTAARSATSHHGKNSLFRPGWDCHGLPIEWKVEENFRAKGVDVSTMSIKDFRAECREYAEYWVEQQESQMKRLAVFADWQNPYRSMDRKADAKTVEMVHAMISDYLYSAVRPVLWSVAENTALADAEVIHETSRYQSLYVEFPVKNDRLSLFGPKSKVSFVCWTTTPWSLPGNKAIAVNGGFGYGLYEVEGRDTLYVIADRLREEFSEKTGLEIKKIATYGGWEFQGNVTCSHPLKGFDHNVPVLCAEWVKDTSGTGVVHVAPTLGPDDFRLGKQHNLSLDEVLTEDGKYSTNVPVYAGMTVLNSDGKWGEAQGVVLSDLKENGYCVHVSNAKHEAAFSWRSKTPLLYRATRQFFVNCKELRADAVDSADVTNFFPAESHTRFVSMMEKRPDWCISRQRRWGVPLGIFIEKSTGKILNNSHICKRVQDLFLEHGSDIWYEDNIMSLVFDNSHLFAEDYEKVDDVCDVWFESGAVWAWVNEDEPFSDLFIEGSDQHRGWFQSVFLEWAACEEESPVRNVVTHGFVLDDKGKKMSKSAGNVVDPIEMIEKYSVDVFRHWVLSSDYTKDVKFAAKHLTASTNAVKKFRNTLRWLLGNSDYQGQGEVAYSNLRHEEKMILNRLDNLKKSVVEDSSVFNYGNALQSLYNFCNEDLSGVWFTMVKDILYCDAVDSSRRKSVVQTVNHIFKVLVTLLEPMFPVLALQVREHYHEDFSLVCENTSKWSNFFYDTAWDNIMNLRKMVMPEVDKMQKSGEFKSTLEMSISVNDGDFYAWYEQLAEKFNMEYVFNVSNFSINDGDTGSVHIKAADGHKCPRCWVYTENETDLCVRCESV